MGVAHAAKLRGEIPEATVWVDVDATELLRLRAELKTADPQTTPSLLALIARFTLAGLQRFPQLNARMDTAPDGSRTITQFQGINLRLAVESERGLMAPNLRNADRLSAVELTGPCGRSSTSPAPARPPPRS
ncbi:pyruvate/2-oxoglutarate dehydrogenase complex dihydrolipoamide acyltransferase (E2) component [Kocuria marina]